MKHQLIKEYIKKLIKEHLNYNNVILYHGTKKDFDKFDTRYFNSGSGDGGWLGYGIYLTNDFDYAESYGNVLECKITVKNPYILTDFKYSIRPEKLNNELETNNSRETTKKLINMGYDSVILTYNEDNGEEFIEVCVFNPNNIKILKKN